MYLFQRYLVVCFMALLSACSSMEINSDYDPSVNFSTYKSYGWLPDSQKPKGDPRLDNPLLDSRIRKAVDTELVARGYPQDLSGRPDFLVSYHVAIKGMLDVQSINEFHGYRPGWRRGWGGVGTTTYVREYEKGSLLLDFIDSDTRNLIWRGSARAEFHPSATPEEKTERIRKAVRRMLDQFPPKLVHSEK